MEIVNKMKDAYQSLSSKTKAGIAAITLVAVGTTGVLVGYNVGENTGYNHGVHDMEKHMIKHVPSVKEYYKSIDDALASGMKVLRQMNPVLGEHYESTDDFEAKYPEIPHLIEDLSYGNGDKNEN